MEGYITCLKCGEKVVRVNDKYFCIKCGKEIRPKPIAGWGN
ncbi:MAG TPA: hypothetical protein VF817_03070 [Patescibacteria group bacterium]